MGIIIQLVNLFGGKSILGMNPFLFNVLTLHIILIIFSILKENNLEWRILFASKSVKITPAPPLSESTKTLKVIFSSVCASYTLVIFWLFEHAFIQSYLH